MSVKKIYLPAILSQLSAWFAFLLIPLVSMLLIPLFAGYRPLSTAATWALTLAAATIILDFVSRFVFIRLSGASMSLREVWDVFVVSWALAGRSSLAIFTSHLPAARIFHRTNKSVGEEAVAVRSKTTAVIGVLGAVIVIQGALTGQPWVCAAGLLAVLMLPFQWLTSRQLLQYRNHFRVR